MEEVLFKSEQTESRATIAAHLRAVADKLEAGEGITLSDGGESVSLDVPDRPTFEVKAERETGSGSPELSVEFELEWREGESSGGGESGGLSVE
ncbi:amphi-Trp domain-containing protein [Halomarina ordinaria]|uniref:Amphi-Trp domain-containing protein n=1 Tax=Halomarina ordinaria TaxID=3033939 RepID=A0ABD5U942_9EURY|nr:amphi-Trp domain-containing protein [Halomarina sp. PSRA2]